MPSARAGGTPIQFQPTDDDATFWRKIRQLAQLVQDLASERSSTGTTTTTTVVTVFPTIGAPRIVGRETGSGPALELSPAQVNLMLPIFNEGVQGVVPAPGPATGNRYLRDDGAWATITFDLSTLEHGALAGLGNDDHPQYLLRADTRDYMRHFMFMGA